MQEIEMRSSTQRSERLLGDHASQPEGNPPQYEVLIEHRNRCATTWRELSLAKKIAVVLGLLGAGVAMSAGIVLVLMAADASSDSNDVSPTPVPSPTPYNTCGFEACAPDDNAFRFFGTNCVFDDENGCYEFPQEAGKVICPASPSSNCTITPKQLDCEVTGMDGFSITVQDVNCPDIPPFQQYNCSEYAVAVPTGGTMQCIYDRGRRQREIDDSSNDHSVDEERHYRMRR